MSSNEIKAGFFRRFSKKDWLAGIGLHFNLTRIFNILETIQGVDGIYIDKPTSLNGYGWRIGISSMENALNVYPRPWDITFGEGETPEVTLSNCCYMRGPVYRDVGALTCTLTGTEDITICAHINHDTGSVDLHETYDDDIPADADNVLKIPLYIVQNIEGVWSVKVDLRGMTQAVLNL